MENKSDFEQNKGTIFRRKEPKFAKRGMILDTCKVIEDIGETGLYRTITVAYSIFPNGTQVRFAAAIHNQEDFKDSFKKKEHNTSAIARYNMKPIILDIPRNQNGELLKHDELKDFMREALHKHGCWKRKEKKKKKPVLRMQAAPPGSIIR